MKKLLFAFLASVILSGVSVALAQAAPIGKTLGPGQYTATVRALICSACGPKVVETLKSVPEITGVSVDQATSRVSFAVKAGAGISVAALQKKLQAASQEMGMGADYTMQNIKKAAPAKKR